MSQRHQGVGGVGQSFIGGSLQLARRFRIPALVCALAVLVCELVSQPYANMGVCDDWPYILMAQKLAATGHFAYNGWAAPMIGWQLYLGAAFVKLFGASATAVRMSTLLVAMALAFLLQRTLVRAKISERNATIGTLAFVLSPLYLVLAVTFMTDLEGLFALVLCLYGCLRALQTKSSRAAIGWLLFAVLTNAVFGTARQIAWLGILVMVPCTLWLMRAQRRVVAVGAAATAAGWIFMFACLQWLKHQPYTVPEHVLMGRFPVGHAADQLVRTFLDAPFLLLPIVALFLPQVRRSRPRILAVSSVLFLGYLFMATYPSHLRGGFLLEPTGGDWIGIHGTYEFIILKGNAPRLLGWWVQVLFTIVAFGGVYGLIASLMASRQTTASRETTASRGTIAKVPEGISWWQLGVLLVPFSVVYALLLVPRAGAYHLTERYLLGLLVVGLLCMLRYFQERIRPQLPMGCAVLVGIMAVYGIVNTHNTFAIDRARVELANELTAAGIADTAVDNGWEYNLSVELRHAGYINTDRIVNPAHAYQPAPPLPAGTCEVNAYDYTPHIRPKYGISFDPNACYGPAPFASVQYSRWMGSEPGTLYVVYYRKPALP
jgi:4-amino-4-deoxy-L-arabinose transferase-like glycosyltransferase